MLLISRLTIYFMILGVLPVSQAKNTDSPFKLSISVQKVQSKVRSSDTSYSIKSTLTNLSKDTYLIHSFEFLNFYILDNKGTRLPHGDLRDKQGLAYKPEPTKDDYSEIKPGEIVKLEGGSIVRDKEIIKNVFMAHLISITIEPIPQGKYTGTIEYEVSNLSTEAAKSILSSKPDLKKWEGRISSTFEIILSE